MRVKNPPIGHYRLLFRLSLLHPFSLIKLKSSGRNNLLQRINCPGSDEFDEEKLKPLAEKHRSDHLQLAAESLEETEENIKKMSSYSSQLKKHLVKLFYLDIQVNIVIIKIYLMNSKLRKALIALGLGLSVFAVPVEAEEKQAFTGPCL